MQLTLVALVLLAAGPAMTLGFGDGTIELELDLRKELKPTDRGGSSDMAVVMLDRDTGILCFADRAGGPARCRTLSRGFLGWGLTEWYPADDYKVDRFAMARLSDTQALMCYRLLETPNAQVAECRRVISTSGGEGDALQLDIEGVVDLSVACLTESQCVVCYATSTSKVGCASVFVDADEAGMSLVQASAVEVSGGSSVTVVGFSNTTAVVCHQARGAACNVLTVEADRSLSLGENDTSLDSSTSEVDIARLSDNYGVACYVKDSMPQYGVCVPFSLEGGRIQKGRPQPDPMDNVNVGETKDIMVVGISDTTAMACYLGGTNRVFTCSGLVLNRQGCAEDSAFEVGGDKSIGFELFDRQAACSEVSACPRSFLTAASALTPVNDEAMLCYAHHDGIGCHTVGVPTPTSQVRVV